MSQVENLKKVLEFKQNSSYDEFQTFFQSVSKEDVQEMLLLSQGLVTFCTELQSIKEK